MPWTGGAGPALARPPQQRPPDSRRSCPRVPSRWSPGSATRSALCASAPPRWRRRTGSSWATWLACQSRRSALSAEKCLGASVATAPVATASAAMASPAEAKEPDAELASTQEGGADVDAPRCANCEEPVVDGPLWCSGCHQVLYCSSDCLEDDRSFHALRCLSVAGDPTPSLVRSDGLKEGSKVCVHGLTGFLAGLNGREGELEAWMPDVRQWFVRLDGGQIESLDAENLRLVAA
mmetsp:Transcript_94407/g.294049  ORF Transcript_94407/g.294049 Transcript_94407/m.294049 type:complete len:236 (+) Transcript_94407:347-1054(+)